MNILITGGTGFLGTILVKRLVQKQHQVYVLVRNQSKLEALYKHFNEQERQQIKVVEGDLLDENLGISSSVLAELAKKIDAIYHTAAYLSFDEEERQRVFDINLTGTKRVLELATSLDVDKFIHVSTAYTLGEQTIGEEKLHSTNRSFVNTYEESKCHAEHLVMSYQGQMNVMIMRPAIIIGDSFTGEADTTFGLYGILRTVKLLKKKVERKGEPKQNFRLLIEKDTVSNLVPVDFVINMLMLGLTYGEDGKIYHITNPNPPTNGEIFDAIRKGLDFPHVEIVSYSEANELTEEERKLNQPLEVFEQYLNRSITFKRENTKRLLKQANEADLSMDQEMLLRIIKGFDEQE
ncbi:SDR family oxidoreductase [Alkalibacillus aidingensis]|uniref:SDR family oxidoreductase n=1 Tax=Alkalibacillus aidingensis TaxID=2747607 RepID=UPI001660B903|nr:SDR family oxidoreductase [Alkalibacillus aidingensis]